MKKSIISLFLITLISGCSTVNWQSGIAKDSMTEKGRFINLDKLEMEWSRNRKGIGFLYKTKPGTNDNVWSFESTFKLKKENRAVKVKDGYSVKAHHISGKSFEIHIIKQSDGIVEYKYKSI